MKPVVRVELLPSTEQAQALKATLHVCNEAADHTSQVTQATEACDKYVL